MLSILKIIGYAFLALGVFILLGFLLRSYLRFNLEYYQDRKNLKVEGLFYGKLLGGRLETDFKRLGVSIMFIQRPLQIFRHSIRSKSARAKSRKEKDIGPRMTPQKTLSWLRFGRRMVPRMLRLLRIDRIRGDLSVGFDNPAVTGFFISSVYALSAWEALRQIAVTPDFSQSRFEGFFELSASIRLLHLIPISILAYKQFRRT